jgi:hypothetical protein
MVAFDLRDALLAPEFMDQFLVLRRAQAVDNYGRAQNQILWTRPAVGVVTPATPNQLARLPEQQYQSRTIEIVTSFPIQGPSELNSPDIIQWGLDFYVVITLDDWANYGPGFVHVLCTSMDSTDIPPLNPGIGQP